MRCSLEKSKPVFRLLQEGRELSSAILTRAGRFARVAPKLIVNFSTRRRGGRTGGREVTTSKALRRIPGTRAARQLENYPVVVKLIVILLKYNIH
jgi:hypothetical protein